MRERLLAIPLLVLLCAIAGLAMFLPAAHASILSDHASARAFFYAGLLVLVVCAMVWLALSNRRPANVARSQLVSVAAAYALVPAVLALPVVEAMPDTTLANAWFEMISTFTTTGATVYPEPGRISETMHLWRALTGWLGGFFILVSATAILAPMNLGGVEVLSGRMPGQGRDGVAQIARVADPAERLWRDTLMLFPIYAGLTLALWLILMVLGEQNLVALVHAMSALSTSGIGMSGDLTTLSSGVAGEMAIFAFLLIALTRRALPGMPASSLGGPLRHDPEVLLAAALIAVTTGVLFLRHWFGSIGVDGAGNLEAALRALWGALFTVVSFLTTTGFASAEWEAARAWSGLSSPALILAGLAMIGGGVATTAGGVKLLRVYALFRHGERELERMFHPSSVGGAGQVARRLRNEGAYFAWLFFMLFALSIAVGVLALSLVGLDFEPALILTLAALTTTGQLADIAADAPIRYADLAPAAKAILGAIMVVGRLETLAILALISPSGWRR